MFYSNCVYAILAFVCCCLCHMQMGAHENPAENSKIRKIKAILLKDLSEF